MKKYSQKVLTDEYSSDIIRFVIKKPKGEVIIMKKILALVMALCMVFALCACGKSAAPASNTLVMGTSADYAPFEFMYKDDSGEMVYGGLDVAVAQFVADDMKLDLQVENMNFEFLLVNLQKGDYDIVIAAIEDTEEREAAADFSDPYYYYQDIPAVILVKAENAEKYKTLADFDGLVVGAQAATTKADLVSDSMPGATLQTLVNVNDLVNELVYGKLDAVVLDGAVAMSFIEQNKDLASAAASSELGEAAPYCIAVQKGDPKNLLPGINAAIAKITAQQISDWYDAANALVDSGAAELVTVEAP